MAHPLLEGASLLYLALPWLIFAVGWLRPAGAAVVGGVLILAGAAELRRYQRLDTRAGPREPRVRDRSWIAPAVAVFTLAVAWTSLCGAGGFGFQNLDWDKHNLLLSDLTEQRWPVDYVVLRQEGSRALPLTYYAAYYLPAAAIGRHWGWAAANDALYAHTLLGAFLALLWFARLTRRRLLPSALLFVALSGLDVIGWLLFADSPYTPTTHLEWWAGLGSFQYSSNTSLLFWVPQHALGGWIATGLVACGERGAPSAGRALFVLALTMLWSPFVALGLAPFALAALAANPFGRALTFANLVAAPVLGMVALLFLASRGSPVVHGWLFSGEHAPYGWGTLAAFYALEVAGFAALARPSAGSEHRAWWWISLALLVVFPLYRVGRFNDFTMRASIPALFVFWSFVARALQNSKDSKGSRWTIARVLLAALVCVGAITPANEIARAVKLYRWFTPVVDTRPLLVQDPLYRSYIGDGQSWFFRHLARRLRQVVTIEAEHPRFTERGMRTEAVAAASDGRVLVLDEGGQIALAYGFELEHPIGEAILVARYRSERPAAFDVAVDGTPRGHLSLPAGLDEWRFANTRISAALGAGWHDLTVRAQSAPAAIDAFILIEADH